MKIPAPLSELLEEGIIDDVHRQLLSGKEASVYVVSRDDVLIAAKVYKARNNRTFKNVTSYVEGRNQTRNTRDKRAKQKKTKYGRELLEESWRSMEHDALQRAFQGGVRVPEPYLLSGDVLLMEYLCDDDGEVAPRLADIDVPFEVAGLLHQEVFMQVRRLLAAGMIHGDLSAFNVLVAPAGLTLIDLPQVVDASGNSEAKDLLCRDLRNITEFFARYDARLLEFVDCGEPLWEHYRKGTLDRVDGPEKARSKPRSGKGRRGRAGDGGLGARADKHANRPRRQGGGEGRRDGRGADGRGGDARRGPPKDKPPRRRGDNAAAGGGGGSDRPARGGRHQDGQRPRRDDERSSNAPSNRDRPPRSRPSQRGPDDGARRSPPSGDEKNGTRTQEGGRSDGESRPRRRRRRPRRDPEKT